MSDEDWYEPHRTPAPPRQPKPAERLFEFLIGHNRYPFELRDHGAVYGVECQIFKNEELLISRRFDPRLDASRPSRELAIAWAEEERKPIDRKSADFARPDGRTLARRKSTENRRRLHALCVVALRAHERHRPETAEALTPSHATSAA